MQEQIKKLEERLLCCLPADKDDDGTFGTDGSHEALLAVFERAFDRAASVANDAIKLLRAKS